MSIKKILGGAAFAAAVMGFGGIASATTIGFDSALGGNPHGVYEEDGYSFTPNSGTNGNCPVATDAPCLKELTQGEITTMTRTDTTAFNLLGFDFLLVGSGNNNDNLNNISELVVTGFDPAKVFTIKMGDALGSFTNYILSTVTGVTTGNVTFNEGYRVTFLNGYFDNIVRAEFETIGYVYDNCLKQNGRPKENCTPGYKPAGGNAQARIDNVVVPDDEVPPVPVPAAGLMLAGALGGLAALRRRKAA